MTTSFDFYSTPSGDSWVYDAWMRSNSDVTQTVERLLSTPHRERTLEYIQDMRQLLGAYPAREGAREQAYRDRWSHLCRQLRDERGHPHLTGIDGGKITWREMCGAPRFDGCA